MGDGREEYRPRWPQGTALHRAVREGWPEAFAAAAEGNGLPRRIRLEVERYLACGDVRRGFAQLKCDACRKSTLVAFSCKQRGLCPSCGARRSHESAIHCGRVLPEVAYRQWTLSAPFALRWALVKDARLFAAMEKRLVRAIWRRQRQAARRLGWTGELFGGAVVFAQYFGSSLQLTPHLHVLVPEGIWDGEANLVPLPPPSAEDVEAVLRRLVRQLGKDFADRSVEFPDDGLEALWAEGIQQRLPFDEGGRRRPARRLAVVEGFSLHADTHVHARDRKGLERLCRYGSRGPLALERLSAREDGEYEYRTRRGRVLVFTAAQLVKRLLALIPPRGAHLTRFHGVFAAHSKLRARVVRQGPKAQPGSPPPPPSPDVPSRAPAAEGAKQKRPRVDWAFLQRHTFEADVWKCPCGGRRRLLAVITRRATAEEVLRNMGLGSARPSLPAGHSPPQHALAL
jgi:hypothetical protein